MAHPRVDRRSRADRRRRPVVVGVLAAALLLAAGCTSGSGSGSASSPGGAAGSTPPGSVVVGGSAAAGGHDPTGASAHAEPGEPSGEVAQPTLITRTELASLPTSAGGPTATTGQPGQGTTTTLVTSTTSSAAPSTTATSTPTTLDGPTTTTTTTAGPPTTPTSTPPTSVPAGCASLSSSREVQVCEIVGRRANDEMRSAGTPGMAVGVVLPATDGGVPVLLEFHYGDAIAASGGAAATPAGPSIHWEMGSETKLFTALLLASMSPLEADGACAETAKVCLNDPISAHLPAATVQKIGAEKAGITLLQLATHTSGLPDDPPNLDAGCPVDPATGRHESCSNWRQLYTDDLLWDGVAQAQLAFTPGESGQWLYSDLGFALLGLVLADVAEPGQAANPFASVVATELTGPLGLVDTGPEDDTDPLLAMGYQYDVPTGTGDGVGTGDGSSGDASGVAATTTPGTVPGTKVVPAPRWDNTNAFIAGGGFTTDIGDVNRFVAASLGYVSTPLDAALREMLAERTDGEGADMKMGLAWQLMTESWFPATYAFKNGGTYGFKSATVVVPSLGYGVTLLSNSPGDPDPVVTGIMQDLRPLA